MFSQLVRANHCSSKNTKLKYRMYSGNGSDVCLSLQLWLGGALSPVLVARSLLHSVGLVFFNSLQHKVNILVTQKSVLFQLADQSCIYTLNENTLEQKHSGCETLCFGNMGDTPWWIAKSWIYETSWPMLCNWKRTGLLLERWLEMRPILKWDMTEKGLKTTTGLVMKPQYTQTAGADHSFKKNVNLLHSN